MPAANYTAIQNAIEAVLQADARTNGSRIFVEQDPQFGMMDSGTVIAVFFEGRSAPAKEQTLSAGKRTRFLLRASCWCFAFHLDYRKACELRNELLDNTEAVLMDNRTLQETATALWLEGGVMFSARNASNQAFVAGAETSMTIQVSAVNS